MTTQEGKFVCDARYELTVHQEVVDGPRYSADKDEALGLREITGRLSGRDDWFDLFGDQLWRLELSDGRWLNFFMVQPATGKIQGTGDFYGPKTGNS